MTDNDDMLPANTSSKEIGITGGTITSTDGLLTLDIPAGALESAETITIYPIDIDDLSEEYEEMTEEVAAAMDLGKIYELGPDGLEFETPITVTFNSDQQPVADNGDYNVFFEFLITSNDGSIEALDNLQTIPDFEEETVTVKGELSHFSPLATSQANNGVSFFVHGVPEELRVNETFTATASIHESMAGPLSEFVTLIGPATYKDNSGDPIEPTFSPTTSEMDGSAEDSFMGTYEYVCTDEGIGIYRSELSVRVRFDLNNSEPFTALSYAPFLTTITCLEPLAPPQLVSPENGEEDVVLNPELKWTAVEGADSYTVQIVENGNSFDDSGAIEETTDGTSFTPTLEPETTWRWRVRALFDENGSNRPGSWSEERTFTTMGDEEDEEPQSSLEFGDPKVCVEHGTSQSQILWYWTFSEAFGAQYVVTLRIKLPSGQETDVTVTSSAVATKLLILLDIFTYGNYEWEIVNVQLAGVNFPYIGATSGEVAVGPSEMSPGECN